jgi:hypothetical protein
MIWIGPVVLAVLAIASVRARDAFDPRAAIAFGFAGAAAAFALALGPVARHVDVVLGPAPYSLLVKLSAAFAGARVPARFGGIALLFLAVAAGAVIALLLRAPRMAAAVRAAVVMAALVSCAVELPVPPLPKGHSLVPTPRLRDRAYRWLAERPGRFGVLELPDWPPGAQVGWQYRDWRSLRYMLASKQHGQHLVNGSARLEPFLWARFRNIDPWSDEFFIYITSNFPVEYILVHQGGLPEDLRRAILSRLDTGQDGWRQVFDSPAIRIYQPDRTFGRGRQIDRSFLRQGLGGFVTIRFSGRLVSNAVATGTLELRQNGALVTAFAIDDQWRQFEASAPVSQVAPEATEWPRSSTLFRWQLSDVAGAEIEVRDLVVEARDGPQR